jgi:RND family efflux transporter MFP subunit
VKAHWKYLLTAAGITAFAALIVIWFGRGVGRSAIKITTMPMSPSIHAEASLICREGAEVTLSAQLAGRLQRVYVKEGQTVHAGQLLAELDSSEPRARFDEAQARLAESMIDEKFARLDFGRMTQLSQHNAVSREQFDRTEHEMERAAAQTEVERAIVARLKAELQKTRITAPFDAVVLKRLANDEEEVRVGTPVLKLADLKRTWVEAQVDELDAPRIRLGERTLVAVEGFAGHEWAGRVAYIAPEMSRRTEISADPSEPTRAQVLRVRIALSAPAPFKLHQRLEVSIETGRENAIANGKTDPLKGQP